MSLTKPLNSKVNMKQYSNADLPVNPKQPAIARYAAESTANQTTINLPFQIDTVNAADSFLLMVDGKVLTPGSTNDYQFAGIDSFGFSSTISLNYSLVAGLNIQAIKLGLKKETEFVQDARFTALYEGIDQGLQGFVRTADLMQATTTTGTPSAGLFYSSISNRASMPDLRTDLKARMGIERIQTQGAFLIANEFGPNGEAVYGAVNDQLGQIRFVGPNWATSVSDAGTLVGMSSTSASNNYVEITFYGTGLNWLCSNHSGSDFQVSVDGGAFGSSILPATMSTVLSGRNYAPNIVIPVAANLSLGVHTIRIRANNNVAGWTVYGFEILNEVSTIRVNPGSSYLAGKKATTIGQASLAYNSGFESGTLGTRGGRVVVYQKADGTIAKAVQPVDASQANLTSANHQNEEIARTFNFREFGAGRADDFSSLAVGARASTFILDDGSTALIADNALVSVVNGVYTLATSTTSNYIILTFIGTGLDLSLNNDNAATRTCSVSIDGSASVGTITLLGNAKRTEKVVSGLPYGTHTVRLTNTAGAINGIFVTDFKVYQPKKPALPAGAVELADYNLLADYVASVGSSNGDFRSTGVITKASGREFIYNGTWSIDPAATGSSISGTLVSSSTASNYMEYTFFGTGINLLARSGGVASTATIQIDGVAYTGAATALGTGSSWTPGTSTFTMGAAAQDGTALQISGLSLGVHKIRVTVATNNVRIAGCEIITPIHSYESNLATAYQNTLPVGSNAISDNRNTSAVKSEKLKPQPITKVYGTTTVSATVSSYIPIPDMSATIMCANDGDEYEIQFEGNFSSNTNATRTFFQIAVDGITVAPVAGLAHPSTINYNVHLSTFVTLSKGAHKIDVYWATDGSGTRSRNNIESAMFIKKVN